jgi:hypothetical protein
MRITRNAGLVEVFAAVTCRAGHAGSTVAILASHAAVDAGAFGPSGAAARLPEMTIHAAGVLKHFGCFLE